MKLNNNARYLNAHIPLLFALLSSLAIPAQARTFVAEGSDSGAGLGARYIAMAGAGVATSDDVYATYYNPAGLADLDGVSVSASRQLNGQFGGVNFLGVAARLPAELTGNFKATLSAAYYPRMHAHAQGAFQSNDFESVFLRYLLPNLSGTFDGEIDSKTKVYRLAVGLGSTDSDVWSVGFNVDRIDCKTNFCGVHATSNGYTASSGGATAISYGTGFKYRPFQDLTLAGAASDIHTQLDVATETTDVAGTRHSLYQISFPKKVLLGAAYRFSPAVLATADYENTWGSYGNNDVNLRGLRLGVEAIHSEHLVSRYGAVFPLAIHFSNLPDKALPFPFSPTFGLGYQRNNFSVDLAVYAHPVMSMHLNRPSMAADLSISVNY